VEREELRFLTRAEVAAPAEVIVPRYRVLVMVGAYGGLRVGELAGLRRSLVDLLRGPSVAQAAPGTTRAPPMMPRRRSDLGCCVVGATGFEPVTSSVRPC
jgi:hypothetical protein